MSFLRRRRPTTAALDTNQHHLAESVTQDHDSPTDPCGDALAAELAQLLLVSASAVSFVTSAIAAKASASPDEQWTAAMEAARIALDAVIEATLERARSIR